MRSLPFSAGLLALLLGCCCASVQASVIVSFDPRNNNYNPLSGNNHMPYEGFGSQGSNTAVGDLDGDLVADDIVAGRRFSETTPMNPNHASYNLMLPSAVYYGGYVVQTINQTTNPKLWDSMLVITNDDQTQANSSATGGDQRLFSTHIAQYWDKNGNGTAGTGFLNGADSPSVQVGIQPGDNITVRFKQANQNDPVWRLYWIVRDQNTWFISNPSMVFNQDKGTVDNIIQANDNYGLNQSLLTGTSDGLWAVYDPFDTSRVGAGGAGLDFDFEGLVYSPHNFVNITAVGFYVEIDNHTNDNKFLDITNFSADLTAVPEPGSLALLAFAALGLATFLRRRGSARSAPR